MWLVLCVGIELFFLDYIIMSCSFVMLWGLFVFDIIVWVGFAFYVLIGMML